ncbi:MAG: hypothetical protein HY675_14750 [Chloroflexi bacterium]|nr:hypothetical protein [Chloroflexota bacterium]
MKANIAFTKWQVGVVALLGLVVILGVVILVRLGVPASPSTMVQAGQLQPAPAGAAPSKWDTDESIRGGLKLVATYDSSGPDAWSAADHPMVYITSEGAGYRHRPAKTNLGPGVQIIDAYTKKVVGSALFDLGGKTIMQPHGLGIAPDGKWVYIGFRDELPSGETRALTLVVNPRTLKLDKVLKQEGYRPPGSPEFVGALHHSGAFTDWQGRDRALLTYGFGAIGGPYFLLDPKDDNRVVRAITYDDVRPIGHPYPSPDPTGKFLYISMGSPQIQEAESKIAGIAKLNLETGAVTAIEGVGNHPIGISHTSDGKFTYVNDGTNSMVFKIDNATNKVVAHTSAGVAGPYGNRLSWDESKLYTIGKGEGSHNTGGVVGEINLVTFRPENSFNQPIDVGGSIMDHGILHPDPKLNEMWISSAGTWETIVLDLNTRKVTARIPSPNGGDTHSGGFVRYARDWKGELLIDMFGPQKAMYQTMRERVEASKKR